MVTLKAAVPCISGTGWWGTGAFISVITFGLCAAIIPGGGLFIAGVAFYGAYAAWRWHWWQAGLFAFPGVALTAAVILFGGVASLWGALFDRRKAP